jgi:hypothetical protein
VTPEQSSGDGTEDVMLVVDGDLDPIPDTQMIEHLVLPRRFVCLRYPGIGKRHGNRQGQAFPACDGDRRSEEGRGVPTARKGDDTGSPLQAPEEYPVQYLARTVARRAWHGFGIEPMQPPARRLERIHRIEGVHLNLPLPGVRTRSPPEERKQQAALAQSKYRR